jgi:hypothetical protein
VSGLVTEATEIECEREDAARASNEDNSGPGSENSGPGSVDSGNDEDGDVDCTTAELTTGAIVEEAELELKNGVATFEEIELAG